MTSTLSDKQGTLEGQGLSPREQERAHLFLRQTRGAMIGAMLGLSEQQWQFRPTPQDWSIAQIAEHVAFVLERVSGPLQEALRNAPRAPVSHDRELVDSIIMYQFPNRLTKYSAPEFALPANRFATPEEAMQHIVSAYCRLEGCLDAMPDLREHALEAFPLKAASGGAYEWMDGYQWILAAAAHTERHAKQILEWKADKAFPRN